MIIFRPPAQTPDLMRYVTEVRRHRIAEHGRTDGMEIHLTRAQAVALGQQCGIPNGGFGDQGPQEGDTGQVQGIPFVVYDEPQPQCAMCFLEGATADEVVTYMRDLQHAPQTQYRCQRHEDHMRAMMIKFGDILIARSGFEGRFVFAEETPAAPPLTPERMTEVLRDFTPKATSALDSRLDAQERPAEGGA